MQGKEVLISKEIDAVLLKKSAGVRGKVALSPWKEIEKEGGPGKPNPLKVLAS